MAKKLVSINLDESLISEIDKMSESLGMSRSAFVSLIMRGTCMGETAETVKYLMSAAVEKSTSKTSGSVVGETV